uniref:NYN domain-containing protein n=1 Tax=Candidatus Kentrum sp. DK TaxID=2126562 RepID=A0A450SHH7_9GAMM|nr:MAG: NYN domain-containing protein [Candidatus Kentron sp. DK]
MTDVNIAAQLLCDAYDDHFDTALILSGDSDLNTPVKIILTRFPDKKVIVVFPPRSLSDLGVRREGKRDRDQNLCKFEANSELFNENLRGFWPISAFPQQNHPKSDRLLDDTRSNYVKPLPLRLLSARDCCVEIRSRTRLPCRMAT